MVETQDVTFVCVVFDFYADEGGVVCVSLEIGVEVVMFWFGEFDVSFYYHDGFGVRFWGFEGFGGLRF